MRSSSFEIHPDGCMKGRNWNAAVSLVDRVGQEQLDIASSLQLGLDPRKVLRRDLGRGSIRVRRPAERRRGRRENVLALFGLDDRQQLVLLRAGEVELGADRFVLSRSRVRKDMTEAYLDAAMRSVPALRTIVVELGRVVGLGVLLCGRSIVPSLEVPVVQEEARGSAVEGRTELREVKNSSSH